MPGEDDFSDLPIGLDDDGVGDKDCPEPCAGEVGLNLPQRSGVAFWQGSGGRWDGKDGGLPGATTGVARVVGGARLGTWFLFTAHTR